MCTTQGVPGQPRLHSKSLSRQTRRKRGKPLKDVSERSGGASGGREAGIQCEAGDTAQPHWPSPLKPTACLYEVVVCTWDS